MERNKLHAVLDEDLEGLLRSLRLLDSLQAGELFCGSCETLLTTENLQVLVPREDGAITLICSNADCVAKMAQAQGGDD